MRSCRRCFVRCHTPDSPCGENVNIPTSSSFPFASEWWHTNSIILHCAKPENVTFDNSVEKAILNTNFAIIIVGIYSLFFFKETISDFSHSIVSALSSFQRGIANNFECIFVFNVARVSEKNKNFLSYNVNQWCIAGQLLQKFGWNSSKYIMKNKSDM